MAGCEVCIRKHYPATVNDPALSQQMLPTLQRVAGPQRLTAMPKLAGGEDFSFFQQVVPGLFFFVGVTAPDIDPAVAPPNHSPRFRIDEDGLVVGVRALAQVACEFLEMGGVLR